MVSNRFGGLAYSTNYNNKKLLPPPPTHTHTHPPTTENTSRETTKWSKRYTCSKYQIITIELSSRIIIVHSLQHHYPQLKDVLCVSRLWLSQSSCRLFRVFRSSGKLLYQQHTKKTRQASNNSIQVVSTANVEIPIHSHMLHHSCTYLCTFLFSFLHFSPADIVHWLFYQQLKRNWNVSCLAWTKMKHNTYLHIKLLEHDS